MTCNDRRSPFYKYSVCFLAVARRSGDSVDAMLGLAAPFMLCDDPQGNLNNLLSTCWCRTQRCSWGLSWIMAYFCNGKNCVCEIVYSKHVKKYNTNMCACWFWREIQKSKMAAWVESTNVAWWILVIISCQLIYPHLFGSCEFIYTYISLLNTNLNKWVAKM